MARRLLHDSGNARRVSRLSLQSRRISNPLVEAAESDGGLEVWNDFALGGFDQQIIPGEHFTLIREPHVKVLGEYLARSIKSASN